MKKVFSMLMLLCLTMTVVAQDIVVKKDGTTIKAQVTEVSRTEIKYKRFDNPKGPVYTISVTELLAINYENGNTESFNGTTQSTVSTATNGERNLTDSQLVSLYNRQNAKPEKPKKIVTSKDLYNKGINQRKIGYIIGGASILAGGALVCCGISGHEEFVVTGSCLAGTGLIVGTIFVVKGQSKINKSRTIQSYALYQQEFPLGNNKTLAAGPSILKNNLTKEYSCGISLCMNF